MRLPTIAATITLVLVSLSANATTPPSATIAYLVENVPAVPVPILGTGMAFLLGILLCLTAVIWLRRHFVKWRSA